MSDPRQNPQNPPTAQAPVRNLATKPPGIIPKNAQTWVIVGVSVVMVAAIALSGGGSKGKPTANNPQQGAAIDPNAARIAQYQNQLELATRKLQAEQATLNQAKQAAAAGADPRVTAAMQSNVPTAAYPEPPRLAPPDDRRSAEEQLEVERERKEYDSLFASNVALSLRKITEGAAAPSPSAEAPAYSYTAPFHISSVPGAQAPPVAPSIALGAQGVTPGAGSLPNPVLKRSEAQAREAGLVEQRPRRTPDSELDAADGKSYRLHEGTLLETVLTNRLTGSFAGPVNAMLTADVYSPDGEHLLIPKGSRILGEVKPVTNFGQQRLALVFHRIIMPDGYSVSLDQFQGLNQIGETGLRDQVNHHYVQIFGVSIAIGAVAGLAQATTQYGYTVSPLDEYRQGFAASLSESALRILDRFLNILPIFTVREGHRIKIYLASDLLLPAYDQHRVPNGF